MKNNDAFYLTIPLVKSIEKDVDYSGNYLVYGQGGFGKTTSMLMLFRCFLSKAKKSENIVPIYIDSKGLDFTYYKPVFEYIIREYCGLNKDISQHIETLNDLLKNSDKKYYIIIDAINEAESNKYKVIRDIALLKEIFDKNHTGRLFVSSRTDENVYCFNDFKRIKMLDFKDEQMVDFLNKYNFKNNGKSIDKIDVERIDKNLLKILRVPMFLKIFKEVYKDADVFPDLYKRNIIRESDLLGKFVDKIIDDKIGMHKAEQSPEYIKVYFALKRFLPALAFELAKNDEFSISDTKLKKLFLEKFNQEYFYQFENLNEIYYDEIGSLKRILRNCIEDFSFIVNKGDKNSIEYSFSHQVWRDYFSAVYLATSMDYDVAGEFEYQISDNIQQYAGEIIKEYEFENKTDILSPMSPIEAFMQRNCNTLSPLAVRLCIEIMKKSRNGKLTAKYNHLDLRYINFYDYNLQGSSFADSKVYEHNFIPQGHTSRIDSVSYSPNGERIVSGSWDKTIRIWDAETGKQIGKPFEGHVDHITSVSYSPNGKRIVSGSWDATIRIWDAETGEQIGKPLVGHEHFVNAVAYSPDGNRIVSGSHDNTIRIWDAETGIQIDKPIKGHTHLISAVAYSYDGKFIASGSWDKTIRIWDAETGEQIGESFKGHTSAVVSVSYSPNGKMIVSSSWDKTIRIWNAKTGEQIGKPIGGHDDSVNSVIFSFDGKRIVSGSNDKTIRIWDVNTRKQIGNAMRNAEAINSIALSKNETRIVSSGFDKMIRIWNVDTGKQVGETLMGHDAWVTSLSCSPDEKRVASGNKDKTIQIWDIETQKQIEKFLVSKMGRIISVLYSPDGKKLVGCDGDSIAIFDSKAGKQNAKSFKSHEKLVNSILYSPNGKRIVIGSWDKILIFDSEIGMQIGEPIKGHKHLISSIVYSFDGKLIASGSWDRTIRIWDAKTGNQTCEPLEGHIDCVNAVSFSPNGKNVVSASDDKTIRIWDVKTGKQIGKTIDGHDGCVNSVVFSFDGKRIVSGSNDKTIRIWDAETGEQIGKPLVGHTDAIFSVLYLSDGKRIASSSMDETIRIWDLETHLCTVLKGIIQSNIQKCDFRNAIFNSEDINDLCHILYCNGADVPKENEPKSIPFEWDDEELDDKESE